MDLWLLVAAINVLALLLWRATTEQLPSRRARALFAVGAAAALAIIPVALAPDVFGWEVDRSTYVTELPRIALVQLALLGLVYVRGARRPFGRLALKNPDARTEQRSPLEHTADDGDFLCDVIDLKFGSTRQDRALYDGEPKLNGKTARRGERVVHSHGSGATGHFVPEPSTAELTDCWVFGEERVMAKARFSNFDSLRARNDDAKGPRGLSVRLIAIAPQRHGEADRPPIDLVAVSMNRFFAKNREDFVSFSRAMARARFVRTAWLGYLLLTGRTRVPAVWTLLRSRAPLSYAEETYHSLNAFWLVTSADEPAPKRTPVRFRFDPLDVVPQRPEEDITLARRLHQDLGHRLDGDGEVRFAVSVVLGDGLTSERINDPMVPWPKRCPQQRIGTLVLERVESHEHLDFNPHHLCRGIEPSDDEILMARRAAYPASVLGRRAARAGR